MQPSWDKTTYFHNSAQIEFIGCWQLMIRFGIGVYSAKSRILSNGFQINWSRYAYWTYLRV